MPSNFVDFPFRLYFSPPQDYLTVLGWIFYSSLLVVFLKKFWQPITGKYLQQWWLYGSLAILAPIFTLIAGIQIGATSSIPLPNLPQETTLPVLFLLFAVPWQIAGGIFGVGPAFIIGLISGLCLSGWNTHSIFTVLETAGMAMSFAFLVRQNYRSRFFSLARIPVFAAIVTAALIFPFLLVSQFLSVSGSLAIRIDYALSQTIGLNFVRMAELIFGGLIVSILYWVKNPFWQHPTTKVPSPIERKIEYRFLFGAIPFFVMILIVLMVSTWWVAGGAATKMVEDRLRGIAEVTSDSLPYFLEAGQNLLLTLGEEDLIGLNNNQVELVLAEKIRAVPFFRQLFLFDENGKPLGGYPVANFDQLRTSAEESNGIQLALHGVTLQTYTTQPWVGETTAQVSFIVSIKNSDEIPVGVLLGRTDLNTNPFTQPAIEALMSATEDGGEGFILDDKQRILFDTFNSTDRLFTQYSGELPDSIGMFENYSPQGTRQLVYYQPMIGRPWSVLISTPAKTAQELALKNAAPMLIVLLVVFIVILVFLRFSLRPITRTVKTLSVQATKIAQGDLDHLMEIKSVDEFGQLAVAFEQMRIRLRDRLDELKHLLISSQSVAEHLDIYDAIQPVLEAALSTGGTHARVVLISDVVPEKKNVTMLSIGAGEQNEMLASLDKQMFELLKYQDILPITNLSRLRRINFPQSMVPPGAILGIALHHENEYFGALWIAYRKPKTFGEEEIRYLSTLAGQAAMAAANAKLYTTAELGRQQLEAVLNSTPEPVMVFDEFDQLLLLNPTAIQLKGLIKNATIGAKIGDVLEHEPLLDLLSGFKSNRDTSRDIQLADNRVYFTTVSPVIRQDRMVGKVCILRDITHFKELDTLKSDIVATVSHDLRSPLTLMRGYATMLQMVGDLNDQQRTYVSKIVSGVDGMSKLVNNLLDLGRIEAGIGLNVDRINPGLLAEQVVVQLQPQAAQKNIELTFDNQMDNEFSIQADPALLQQALINLVENSIKYSGLGAQVSIHLTHRDKHILFEVRDTGIGIAPIDLPRLFDKFYRSGRKEAYKQRGTGLGLAIVKSIVEHHRGRTWVESKLGRGSSFYLEIPFELS
jgi:signal transduction histidine kinase/HAMP domain-containing protein